jgi:hypothetical protein
MGFRVIWPIVFLLLLDIFEVVVVIVLGRRGSYEASMMAAYIILGLTVLQLGLCVFGFLRRTHSPNLSLKIVYVGHAIASIVMFVLAETGTFRGDR